MPERVVLDYRFSGVPFTKYHGLGNDFVIVDARETPALAEAPALAVAVCDRHQGIGGDGLLFVLPAADAHVTMHLYNSDGTVARMCGNGIRCLTRFVYEQGIWGGAGELVVRTASGLRTTEIVDPNPANFLVRVNLRPPLLAAAAVPTTLPHAPGEPVMDALLDTEPPLRVTCLSLGNPHAVVFVDDLDAVDVARLGPLVETHPAFPDRTNAHFVQVLDHQTLRMRTWERGAGLTLACGTGASASTVAAALTGRAGRRATVYVPGGQLEIDWCADSGDLMMTGPATRVFDGILAHEIVPSFSPLPAWERGQG
ncbi:MAG: diaminopimelate epimerase [Anaerolineae bacterium]